jgi:hypothetical protein
VKLIIKFKKVTGMVNEKWTYQQMKPTTTVLGVMKT